MKLKMILKLLYRELVPNVWVPPQRKHVWAFSGNRRELREAAKLSVARLYLIGAMSRVTLPFLYLAVLDFTQIMLINAAGLASANLQCVDGL